ncbi:MAG TPA: hypothetical protein VK458_15065 [Myxococcaceae bacterium]|nr:hypothetical protein [Myxococcaceae bacterium]
MLLTVEKPGRRAERPRRPTGGTGPGLLRDYFLAFFAAPGFVFGWKSST